MVIANNAYVVKQTIFQLDHTITTPPPLSSNLICPFASTLHKDVKKNSYKGGIRGIMSERFKMARRKFCYFFLCLVTPGCPHPYFAYAKYKQYLNQFVAHCLISLDP